MEKSETDLPGVFILTPKIHRDDRGHFYEVYNSETMKSMGFDYTVAQINQSVSRGGVLRGLHYQLLKPQAKIVRVLQGKILDVAVDIRIGSPTFKKHIMVELADAIQTAVYIPAGFAHGFYVLSQSATVEYTCDALYSGPGDQRGIYWGSTALAIRWPFADGEPITSHQDGNLPRLQDIPENLLPHMNAPRK
jgi:dTDP-4-dehydrorhamnose 3,5-epimerase